MSDGREATFKFHLDFSYLPQYPKAKKKKEKKEKSLKLAFL